MPKYAYPFSFSEDDSTRVAGQLVLDDPLPYRCHSCEGLYRPASLELENCPGLDLVFYHNPATSVFIYLRNGRVDANVLALAGLPEEEIKGIHSIYLPGQLCLGSDRAGLVARAIEGILGAPALRPVVEDHQQHNLAVFPIAREGLKYQVAEAIYRNYGYYTDEVVLDAHHVFDRSVPVYNRKVEMTLFKDKDLDRLQHEQIAVAFIADSIASGLVLKEVIERVKARFENLQRVEVIAPLATIRGLSRIAQSAGKNGTTIRLHVFETPLNALPPDYYYSAHYPIPALHIRPDLEEAYRAWWGRDGSGNFIADTACAGYGWSEAFYSPRKQIQMMNAELGSRHGLTIAEIIRRNIQ